MSTTMNAPSSTVALAKPLTPAYIAVLWGTAIFVNGLLYHTYSITVANGVLETSRQLGVTFLAAECAVIFLALQRGLSLIGIWTTLARATKICLALFLATFWISSVFMSAISGFATILCLATVVHLAFLASVIHLVAVVDRASLDRMGLLMALGATVFALWIAAKMLFASDADLAIVRLTGWQFAIPGFISVRMFGATCGALLSFTTGLAIVTGQSGRTAPWKYYAVALFSAMTVWTATRAALLGSVVAISILMILFRPRVSRNSAIALIGSAFAGCAIASLLGPYSDDAFRLVASGDFASSENLTGGRLSLWKSTFDAFLQNPVFGWGAAANRWALQPPFYPHMQPHSFVLQFLVNWGVIAAFAAFAMLVIATWNAHRIAIRNRSLAPVLAMLDCLLVMAFFDGILYFSGELMLVAICFGIIFKTGQVNDGTALDH